MSMLHGMTPSASVPLSANTSTAVVTGGNSGIGRATVELLLTQGWKVVVIDRDISNLDAVRPELTAYQADARDPAAVENIFTELAGSVDRVDALVNAVGIEYVGTLEETSPDEWHRVVDTNLTSYYLLCRAALPLLRQRGGAVVNVASQLSLVGTARFSAYTASKAGIIGLSRSLALELAPHGIRVNVVCPGAVDTPLLQRQFADGPGPQGSLDDLAAMHALRRLGEPAEIAAPIGFLCGPGSSFMTGSVVVVDGGYTSW